MADKVVNIARAGETVQSGDVLDPAWNSFSGGAKASVSESESESESDRESESDPESAESESDSESDSDSESLPNPVGDADSESGSSESDHSTVDEQLQTATGETFDSDGSDDVYESDSGGSDGTYESDSQADSLDDLDSPPYAFDTLIAESVDDAAEPKDDFQYGGGQAPSVIPGASSAKSLSEDNLFAALSSMFVSVNDQPVADLLENMALSLQGIHVALKKIAAARDE